MPKHARQQKYLDSGAAAGLVRVEVLVPAEDRSKILEFAADLRSSHRQNLLWTSEFDRLFEEAVSKYRARCLWNIQPTRSRAGLALIADRLRSNGGMDAWKLASQIRESLDHAH
jgi:hypothetical protein